jgi:putative transposase
MNKQKNIKLKSRSHMTFRLCYHIVLTLKYRHDILTPEMQSDLKAILTDLMDKWECEVIEIGGEGDHVHVLIDGHPRLNLVNFIKNVKSVSSRRMREKYSEYLEQYLWGGEFWNDGSTVLSVGSGSTLDILIPYIQNQGEVNK